MANIQMANEYLHQLLGWMQYQEQESHEPFEAPSVVARAWDGYHRAKDMFPGPDLKHFSDTIVSELARFK